MISRERLRQFEELRASLEKHAIEWLKKEGKLPQHCEVSVSYSISDVSLRIDVIEWHMSGVTSHHHYFVVPEAVLQQTP